MKQSESLKWRSRIVFAASAEAARAAAEELAACVAGGSEEALQAAADVAVDLASYLTHWTLEEKLSKEEIAGLSKMLLDAAGSSPLAEEAQKEIASIRSSSMCELTRKTDAGELATYWGHDYASGLTHSLRRGARWVTNNPCKNTLFKKDFPELYEELLNDIVAENPDMSEEDMVSMVFAKICALSARELRPIHEATKGEYGFVCVQVNPFNIPFDDSAEKIIRQVRFWNEAFKKELGVEDPNIVYKIPAVRAGLEACPVLLEEGFRLCLTLDFTVTQHDIFARILSAYPQKGFVVLMGGLLDDKVTKELEEMGVEEPRKYGLHAAQAVIRKSYANLHAKGYDKNVSIMTAAVRGPWAIANTMAPGDGAVTLITTLTNKILEFDGNPTPLESHMADPVDPEIMAVLEKSKVFRQAYCMPSEGLLGWEDLYEFPPFMAFYDQFRDAYAELTEDIRAKR
ncbi:MAG: hypothetical protein IKE30_10835 [Clostridia bacterium]|nr:hypothetical protein [Clostridia bacterium]